MVDRVVYNIVRMAYVTLLLLTADLTGSDQDSYSHL